MVGSRTYLFWASSDSEAAKKSEDSLFALLGRTEENDDPNMLIKLVRRTFMSIYNGVLFANKDDKFFILGLAPNSARIAVVYWNELPLREFAGLISKHFADMEIVDTRKDKKPYVGLHSILGNVTLGGKSSDATPNLPDAVASSKDFRIRLLCFRLAFAAYVLNNQSTLVVQPSSRLILID